MFTIHLLRVNKKVKSSENFRVLKGVFEPQHIYVQILKLQIIVRFVGGNYISIGFIVFFRNFIW